MTLLRVDADALRLQVGTPVVALFRVGRLLTDALRLQVGTPVGSSAQGARCDFSGWQDLRRMRCDFKFGRQPVPCSGWQDL